MIKIFPLAIIALLVPAIICAQRPSTTDTSGTTSNRPPQRASTGIRPYNEVVTNRAKTDIGLFKVHQTDDNYLFEIPESLLGRDILVVNRISKAAAEGRVQMIGYAGDQIGDNVIRFERGTSSKIFLKNISFQEYSRDTTENGMFRSVINSNLQPISASFDIKAFGKDSVTNTRTTVIDVSQFVNSDNDILFFSSQVKRALSLGMQQPDRSYIQTIKSFPQNIEIRTIKTYIKTPAQGAQGMGQAPAAGGPATYELNSSLVLLPKVPMQPRYFDPRVGYFATGYTDFDLNPQGVKRISMITRWRLEPKPQDIEKYNRGELVEPQKPIVFYIDPATPKKWVPYLIQGVNDWNVAFEKAGWKNAIIAKEAPRNNPEWSLEDARHSAIVYKPSDIPNASGPHVHDPRSGEILETHVNWYHNVMQLVRNWYLIQASAIDPRARKMTFDDELMGQLIRFVSSHEVGHTLGLRHNYGASSTVPVEKLRDKQWVEANGHTPSIMDYARFNYVAQPEDNITEKGIYPRIGDYDKWAIEWGYRWFPTAKSPEAEKPILNKWVMEKLGANKHLWFGTETDANDPRGQNEDLGDDAMKAGTYGIKNLQRILPNLLDWTKEANADYSNARTMYNELVGQFNRYMGHVAKNIGGVTTTPRMVEEGGLVYEFVPEATQKQAMSFLNKQLFTTPVWLMNKKLYTQAGVGTTATITTLQQNVVNRLISSSTIEKLLQFEAFDPNHAYTASEMLSDLKKSVWTELTTKKPIDIYRRNLQKIYVERLISIIKPEERATSPAPMQQAASNSKLSDVHSLIKGQLREISSDIRKTLPVINDTNTRLHLMDVMERINDGLKPNV